MSGKFIGIINHRIDSSTVVIIVKTISKHLKYKKVIRKSRKYLVHDPIGKYNIGDIVYFKECVPISRCKKWMILGKKDIDINEVEEKVSI